MFLFLCILAVTYAFIFLDYVLSAYLYMEQLIFILFIFSIATLYSHNHNIFFLSLYFGRQGKTNKILYFSKKCVSSPPLCSLLSPDGFQLNKIALIELPDLIELS
jgi:hypothetical protein